MKKRFIKKTTKLFEILLFITVVINIFLLATKNESKIEKANYKILVQEEAGSSNYVEYSGSTFPKRGYTLASYTCDNTATITQNTISKKISFSGPANKCTLKFDISSVATGQTLQKLQELSSQWTVNSGSPDLNKTSPRYNYTDNGFTGSASSSGSVRNQYYTYATSYTFNQETGKYSLVNPQVIRFNSSTNGNTLNGKYIVNPEGSSSNSTATYQNLDTIYKVTAYTYILQYTISSIPSSTSSSVVCTECGIWQEEDDYGNTYYVRGAYDYNYVKFGKNKQNQDLYWRIIRINGDESLRLMYAGTSATAKSNIGTSAFNTSTNDNAYVGYMYGTAGSSTYNATHANTNSSAFKNALDTYYSENLNSYSDYIADVIFCNNRSIHSGNGYGTQTTYYGFDDYEYSFKCKQKNDAFTVHDTEKGNGALAYPIGTLTADEVVRGGITGAGTPTTNYLTKDYVYFTMTPHDYANNSTYMFGVTQANILAGGNGNNVSGVVPVINLTPEAVQTFTGTGTSSNPFTIADEGSSTTPVQTNIPTLQKLQTLNSNITVNQGTPNFANTATTDEGLYASTDDYGTSYYWRGASTTNYIKFGDLYCELLE